LWAVRNCQTGDHLSQDEVSGRDRSDGSVVIDLLNRYFGERTRLIRLAGNDPRGIHQAGLVLGNSKAYSARVVLAGEPGAT